ncbi:MAG: dihydrofolate reductase [Chloroflexi bacterium]|jgi:dihydrofolate reductase|nr:dihydrofolate reductase [Chloroflexota bacterium]MBT3671140.1 dihydrofolate reductase [Chloroflexota bacterium]MBT4004071.1 dihydrofolate reductase [Chloroflexota bacterium]MBT4304401.1 dihydrofolate reductase [Chloroflexota bacterium]MBT4534420.1 dihydrofolate reductase [Chloroflexota bacterium]
MIISMIVAVSENGVIGKDGDIPWRLSADLQRFKHLTMDHHLVMGRKTYESIGKPLPGRKMVIVTRQEDYSAPGCEVVHSLEEALSLAEKAGETEVFIAGGASIYAEAFPLAQRLYYTQVHDEVDGDTLFPTFAEEDWQMIENVEYPADLRNDYSFTFTSLKRNSE